MKRSFVRSFRLFMLLLSAMVAGGCESVTITAVEIVVVRVSPLQIVVFVDATERLSARAQDASGNSLTGRTITWSSTNSSVASVDASGLVRGIAAGTATIRATAEGVVGSAEVTVILRPSIVLSVSEVQLESDFAGEPTESVPIEISNGTTGTLSELQIGVSYPSGGPQGWVETDLSSATAPATLSIRAIPTALPAGTHEAEVEVRSAVAGNSPQAIRVVLEVGEAPPSVEVSSEVVSFASDAGQAGPPPQVLTVTNGGGGDLTGIEAAIEYEPGSGDGWLQTSLDGTTAPAQLTVVADPQGLAPGVYDAVITVTAAGAPGSVAEVRVRFRFGSPPPEIEIVPASLPWEILEATPINPHRSVQVGNRGTGTLGSLTLEVTYGPGGASGWLGAQLDAGTAPTNLLLTIADPGLLPGEYSADVVVSSPDAINSPQTLEVVLTVLPRPSLVLSTITPGPRSRDRERRPPARSCNGGLRARAAGPGDVDHRRGTTVHCG